MIFFLQFQNKIKSSINVTSNHNESNFIPSSYNFFSNFPECDFGPLTQQCGSCYAYSAAKVLSHRFCRHTHKNLQLSVQYLLLCDLSNAGCNGGNELVSLKFLEEYGIPTEQCFPFYNLSHYSPDLCSKCLDHTRMHIYKAKPWSITRHSSVESIKQSIYQDGPVSACIEYNENIQSYTDGILKSSKPTHPSCSHTVEIIGWGEENNVPYWLVGNHFGLSWGQNGTMKIRAGHNDYLIESFVYSILPDLSVL